MTYKLLFFIFFLTLTSHLKAHFIFSNDTINNIEIHRNDSSIKANVYFFLSPECPLCRSYTSTINELYSRYQTKGFNFIGVITGTQFSTYCIEEFKNRYHLKPTIIIDANKKITNQLKATITPEVFVVGTNGYTLYSGRIDDWAYALGKKRKHITDHSLVNALEDILNEKIIKNPKTTAIGCYIE